MAKNWLKNLRIGSKILLLNAIPAFLLVVFVVAIYFSINSLLETSKWVTHTEQVISKGHELMEELLNMETGERGFLITGKPQFLEPYEKARKTFNKTLDETLVMVSDNPAQIRNLERIELLTARWLNEAGNPEQCTFKGLKVLIVDDNATNRMVLNKSLSNWGAETDEVNDGQSCLDELSKAKKSGQPYGLILLDYDMPGMDGFEVAEKVKSNPELDIPIIIISSSMGSANFRGRLEKLGIKAYILKPVKQSELRTQISIALGKSKPEEPEKQVVVDAVATETPLKILLVEDNKDNRNLIVAYLKKSLHVIELAENGQIAVEKFISGDYDLVLMDMQMPVMDGLTATKNIREWEVEQSIEPTPIVALTAHALKEDEEKSKEAGCNDHVTKPIKKATLLKTIRKYGKDNNHGAG